MPTPVISKSERVTIVGAGLFGLTTALELAQRGYNVLVLDRDLPPVLDGSSVDISRVIRPDYADEFYTKMGLEAMQGWEEEFAPFFHRSGLLCVAQDNTHAYLEESRENLEKMGLRVESLEEEEIKKRYPAVQGDLKSIRGYINPISGWADAKQSIQEVARKCVLAGVSFVVGAEGTVSSLIKDGDKVIALKTSTGAFLRSHVTILATGARTPHLIDMDNVSISTSQPVGFIQLTEKEAEELKSCPVIINLSTGWFIFPPTPKTHILKMARHGYGYEVSQPSSSLRRPLSAPRLGLSNIKSAFLPADAELALKDGLSTFFPQFKDKEFSNRRLCWYSDTPKGDFIVDYHYDFKNLFIATGDSGHAFKFLPVLGRYVADSFEGKASETQKKKWKLGRSSAPISRGDGSRGGPPRRALNAEELSRL
ncbi:FAD dependent oxidoreductase [Penicillium cataractarum]|uniref:FAD dependent oxidoreductase n=1 Tax=Penicillium cataractarum TaxID=2100454 RepID=A0A9W9V6E5_9EURO|nr:FAD dependent oxidoreductase [Penicillium cataractarum]KAJ5367946.1 FAD dependent oxidoreductase [Penicillium cataractarum]